MKILASIASFALIILISSMFFLGGSTLGGDPISSPSVVEDSPNQQSAWLDQTIPLLTKAMNDSRDIYAKVSSPLVATPISSLPINLTTPSSTTSDAEQLSSFVDKAALSNARYNRSKRSRLFPNEVLMPITAIKRIEIVYSAPPPSEEIEMDPLVISAWICPNRSTALAIFWLRNGTQTLDLGSPETLRKSILSTMSHPPYIEAQDNPPGELAYWNYPRSAISVVLTKGSKPMPADRLCFLRRNIIIEAATVEYTRNKVNNIWKAYPLKHCSTDISAMMRSIDSLLLGLARVKEDHP